MKNLRFLDEKKKRNSRRLEQKSEETQIWEVNIASWITQATVEWTVGHARLGLEERSGLDI